MDATETERRRAARVRELFDELVDLPASEQARVLDRECGADGELRRLVEDLLRGTDPDTFLESAPRPPVDLGERLGPYRLLRRLGEGGMGVVHEAEDTKSGERLAVKTVRVPQAWKLDGLRREIGALRRIRHRGVVRVVDDGIERGVPWYAMELVEGTTLREWADRDPVSAAIEKRQLTARLTVARRLCETLSYLHGEGIIHRDLKPDNVLMRADGWPVLVDFGLVATFANEARETLEADSEALGTIGYVAPEQIRREPVDARADIYAVGAILYELLTGEPPLGRSSTLDSVARLLSTPPPPPSSRVEGVPASLDRLVMSLLAIDPGDRIGHADLVAGELVALGAEGSPEDCPRPRAYLYPSGFVGRRELLEEIVLALAGAAHGRGLLVTVGGESGVGKTRFASALATRMRRERLRVVVGVGRPASEGGGPLGVLVPLARAIADHCLEMGPAELDRVLGGRGGRLARHLPSLLALPGIEADESDPDRSPRLARLDLFVDLLETMHAFARDRPLLLLIDDLHLADELSREFVVFAAPRLEGTSIDIVATHLADDPVVELAPGARRISLSRLGADDVGGLAAGMMAASVPADLAGLLYEHSGGNPFFVAEYLRVAIADGLMVRDAGGRWRVAGAVESWRALPVPRSLSDLLARRLRSLPPPARDLTLAASVLGHRAVPTTLAAVCAMEAGAFDGALRDLCARDVMVSLDDGHVEFAHVQFREVAYAELGGERRAKLHERAATLLEEAEPLDAAALAHHWDCAGQPERGRPYHLSAARHARALYLHDEAERHYRAYLAASEVADGERVAARNELAEWVLGVSGRRDDALAEHERALAEANVLADHRLVGETLRAMGAAQRGAGRLVEAQRFYQDALDIHRRRGERGRELAAVANLANIHRAQGRIEKARALCLDALGLGRPEDEPGEMARLYSLLAALFYEDGRVDRAASMCERALAAHRRSGNRRGEAAAIGNLGLLTQQLGRANEAEEHFARALDVYRRVGDRHGEALVETNFAALLLELGRAPEAETRAGRAIELCRILGDRQGEAAAAEQLAMVADRRGDVDGALAMLDAALVVHRTVGARKEEGVVLAVIAGLAARSPARAATAAAMGAEAERILREVGAPLELARCLCIRGQLSLRAGRDGGRFLAAAQELAENIPAGCRGSLSTSIAELAAAQRQFESARG